MHEQIKIPYYYAVAIKAGVGNHYIRIVEKDSHPFINQLFSSKLGDDILILFWREITKEEYDFFNENLQ